MGEPSLSPELKKQTTFMYEKNKTNFNKGQYDIPNQSRKTVKITKNKIWETDIAKRSLRTQDS